MHREIGYKSSMAKLSLYDVRLMSDMKHVLYHNGIFQSL